MLTPRQSIALTGVIILFSLDVIISLFGSLFCRGFMEVNPLFAPFVSSPLLYLVSLLIPKIALLWGFVMVTRWFNISQKNEFCGDIACSSALAIQFVYIGWLVTVNFF